MRRLLAGLLLLLVLPLAGCSDSIEIDEQVYILVMGIDTDDVGLSLTVKTPKFAGSTGEAAKDEFIVATAKGRNLHECMDVLRVSLPRHVNYLHVKLIMISEELARQESFFDLVEDIVHTRQISPDATVMISSDEAKKIVEKTEPLVGQRLSRSIQGMLDHFETTNYVSRTLLARLAQDMRSDARDALVIYCSLLEAQDPSELYEKIRQPGDALPEEVPTEGGNDFAVLGAAVMNHYRMVDVLTGYETQLVHLLGGNKNDVMIELEGDGEIPNIMGYLRMEDIPKTSIDIAANTVDIHLSMQVYTLLDRPLSLREREVYTMHIRNEIIEDTKQLIGRMQGLDVDIFGFSGVAIRQFLSIDDWLDYGWRERWPDYDVRIAADVRMRDPGDGPGSQPYPVY